MNNKKHLIQIALGVGITVLVTACASQFEQTEQQVEQEPVDCATAQSDIALLQREKSNVEEQLAMGVSAVLPLGMVVGAATGTERTKAQVATGEYNEMIDRKIAQIRVECGLY